MSDDTHDHAPGASDDDLAALSAVVDGAATADERSRIESSVEWTATVERWREHRAALADPAAVAPPPQVRADALAAAMAVFDELHAGVDDQVVVAVPRPAAVPAHASVIRLDRSRRAMRFVTGAAAAVAVLFVGAAVVGNGFGGGDDEESTSIEFDDAAGKAAPAAVAESDAADAPPAAMDTEIAADATEMGEVGDPSDGGGQIEAGSEAPDEAPTEDATVFDAPETTEAATDTTSAAAGGGVDGIDGPAEVSVTLTSPEQLLDYARSRPAQLPLPGLEFPCVSAETEALGLAEYRGTQVVVTRDPDAGTIEAVDLTTCATIESVTP